MASYYVWSGATGAANGTNWANAYTSFATAFPGKSSGDVFYIAHDHSDITAGTTTVITLPGTVAGAPYYLLCVDRNGSVPPVEADLRTGALFATSTAHLVGLNGTAYVYGLTFSTSNSGVTGSGGNISFTGSYWLKNCTLRLLGNEEYSRFVSTLGGRLFLEDCTYQFGHSLQGIQPFGQYVWRGGSIAGVSPSLGVFANNVNGGARIRLENVDLSAAASAIINPAMTNSANVTLKNCKLNPAMVVPPALVRPGLIIDVIDCEVSGSKRNARYRQEAAEETDEAVVRGSATFSRRVTTTVNATWPHPHEATPLTVWNSAVGVPITLTMEGTWGQGAVPNNNEVWFDVLYPGYAASTLGAFSQGGSLPPGPSAPLAASPAAWSGGTTPFKQSHTITPQAEGWIYVTPKVGRASTVVYFDPEITVS